MKEQFEVWIKTQFGDRITPKLLEFDIEDGYADEVINAMWVGFNAGAAIYGS